MKKVIVLLLVLSLLLLAVAPAFARVGAPGAPGFGSNSPKDPPKSGAGGTDTVSLLSGSVDVAGGGTGGGWGSSSVPTGKPGWAGSKGK